MSIDGAAGQSRVVQEDRQLKDLQELTQFMYVKKLKDIRPDEALTHIYQAIELNPCKAKYHRLAIECLEGLIGQEKFLEAIEAANHLTKKFHDGNSLYYREVVHYKCAGKLVMINRPEDAMSHIYQAIELNPENYEYYTLAIKCLDGLMGQEKFLGAIEAANHLLKNYPNDHCVILHRAQSYLALSDVEDALDDVYSVLTDKSDDGDALELLGIVDEITHTTHQNPFRRV